MSAKRKVTKKTRRKAKTLVMVWCNHTAIEWIVGSDTGISSKTIWATMMNVKLGYGDGDVPLDSDDFGRCHRLLMKLPLWRERLGEVAERHPSWKPLVRAWPVLTKLYVSGRLDHVDRHLNKLNG